MLKYILGAVLTASVGIANATSFTVTTSELVGKKTVVRDFTLSSNDYLGTISGIYAGENLSQDWSSLGNEIKLWDTSATFETAAGSQYSADISGQSLTTSINLDMNYLSLHAGNNTVFFKFNGPLAANTLFTLTTSGNGTGLSNIRGFGSLPITQDIGLPPPPVPEPEEWVMMLTGLALLGFVSKRRLKK